MKSLLVMIIVYVNCHVTSSPIGMRLLWHQPGIGRIYWVESLFCYTVININHVLVTHTSSSAPAALSCRMWDGTKRQSIPTKEQCHPAEWAWAKLKKSVLCLQVWMKKSFKQIHVCIKKKKTYFLDKICLWRRPQSRFCMHVCFAGILKLRFLPLLIYIGM